jgi:small-conductance mechanosensitive channel
MAESIVYRIAFSDEDENVLKELISIGFDLLEAYSKESLGISYLETLKEIELLMLDAIRAVRNDPSHHFTEQDLKAYSLAILTGNYAATVKHAFQLYRFLKYPPSYKKFLSCLQRVLGLGSIGSSLLLDSYSKPPAAWWSSRNKDLSALPRRYSSLLNKSQSLNRELWEAAYGPRDPNGPKPINY